MRRLAPLAALLALAACGGSEEPSATPETTAAEPAPTTEPTTTAPTTTAEQEPTTEATTTEAAPPPPEPPPGVPRFVAGYRGWIRLNDAPIPPRDPDPHRGTKNVYASKERRANGSFPNGTVIVKEARRPGADFVGLLAIMRKERGADPEHGDWVFVEYVRAAARERYRELARDAVCWGCHASALDLDYVFTR